MHLIGPLPCLWSNKAGKKFTIIFQSCSLWALLWLLETPHKKENIHSQKGGEISQTSGSLWGSCCGLSRSHTHPPQTRHQHTTKALLTQDRHCLIWSSCFKPQNATLGYKRAFSWTTQEVFTFSCLHVLPRLLLTSTCRMRIQVPSHWNRISGAALCNIDTKIVWTKEIGFFLSLFFFFLNLNPA